MTPKQFKEARQSLGFTISKLSSILNVDPRTIRRWEADPFLSTARPPHPTACRAMEWLLDGKLKI